VDSYDSMAQRQTKSRKKASFGVLFWLAFLLLVLVVFLYNRTTIENVLETTGLIEVLRERFNGNEEPEIVRVDPDEAPDVLDDDLLDNPEEAPRIVDLPPETAPEPVPPADPDSRDEAEELPDTEEGPAGVPQRPDTDSRDTGDEPELRRRNANIYFIRVTDQGTIYPEGVTREVTYTNNPMTQTLNTLLEGPTSDELNLGLLNLIPDGTRLLSAAVRDRVAYLNFSEEFRFNPMGFEGLTAQLQQIVYSTTEFSTVERVQILIEGELVEYLGVEGLFVGKPLSRDSFG
ncbi:MAG: GerMN domain-containing protein, partial [Spirochaetota bacterium]